MADDDDLPRYSASRVNTYLMCPRKYGFKYVERMPAESRPPCGSNASRCGQRISHGFSTLRCQHAASTSRRSCSERWSRSGTPWKPIPKAEGEHLLPVIYQRRLMLFWLNISDTAQEPESSRIPSIGDAHPAPVRYFNIRLSWSEYRDGAWSPNEQSDAFIGVNERGQVNAPGPISGSALGDLISVGPGYGAAGGHTTLPSTDIHADVEVDGGSSDLLVRLFRHRTGDTFFGDPDSILPQFRASGVDGSVTVEAGDGLVGHTVPPSHKQLLGGDMVLSYTARAQRWHGRNNLAGLLLPLPHPSADGPAKSQVLLATGPVTKRWIQITPSHRVAFDSREPFVFEDNVGSYWVTFDPKPPPLNLSDYVGFDSWVWFGDALGLGPPVLDELPSEVSLAEPTTPIFRNSVSQGIDTLVDQRALRKVLSNGKNVTAINCSTVDKQATSFTLNSKFSVQDPTGLVLYDARAGAHADADHVYEVATAYEAPLIVLGGARGRTRGKRSGPRAVAPRRDREARRGSARRAADGARTAAPRRHACRSPRPDHRDRASAGRAATQSRGGASTAEPLQGQAADECA